MDRYGIEEFLEILMYFLLEGVQMAKLVLEYYLHDLVTKWQSRMRPDRPDAICGEGGSVGVPHARRPSPTGDLDTSPKSIRESTIWLGGS